MTSSQQYIDITLVPTAAGQKRGRSLWVHHILPLPLSPPLARKWDYIVQRFSIWYEDSDGDEITIGSSSELVSAVNELVRERHFVRFQFKMGNCVDEDELLFKFMNQLDKVKIRYRILGSELFGGDIELDKDTKEVKKQELPSRALEDRQMFEEQAKLPEEEVDPAVFETPVNDASVNLGKNVLVGKNVEIGESRTNVEVASERFADSVPEHDDLIHTPDELSPTQSPRLEPFANNDTPLIELPCVPTHTPLAPLQTRPESPDDTADDPPDSPPSESSFPLFPGTFPIEPTDAPNQQFGDFLTGIFSTIQGTLDTLARLGHSGITAAQNTGFPVSNASVFNAHHTIDANTESARLNLESSLDSARTNLESSLEYARTSLEFARRQLQSNLALARTNVESARTGMNAGLTMGLSNASNAMTNATRQVERAIQSAAMAVQQSGAVSPGTAERVIRDLRNAGERVENAVEDMTLRLQRRIDQHALQREVAAEHDEPDHHVDEEDIYGTPMPSSLPGSFPVERSRVEECADRLVEMGFFSEGQRDSASAVSVAAEGDIGNAVEIMQAGE